MLCVSFLCIKRKKEKEKRKKRQRDIARKAFFALCFLSMYKKKKEKRKKKEETERYSKKGTFCFVFLFVIVSLFPFRTSRMPFYHLSVFSFFEEIKI